MAGESPQEVAVDPALQERDERARFYRQARAHTPIVAVDHEGVRFLVSTADRDLGLRLFAKRRRRDAKTLRRALARLHAHGLDDAARAGAFLDVGANIGTACLVALVTAGFRRAIALEPEPNNFALLRANAALNFLDDRLEPFQLAAAGSAGVIELALSKRSSGSHRAREVSSGSKATIEVEAVTLDGLLDRVGIGPEDVGLVWIDVNGFDSQVLAGAERLLAARVPVVVEVSGEPAPLPPLIHSYSRVADLRTKHPDLPAKTINDFIGRLRREGIETDLLLLP